MVLLLFFFVQFIVGSLAIGVDAGAEVNHAVGHSNIKQQNSPNSRQVTFWYYPGSFGGGDINNTLKVLTANRHAVTNVIVDCGLSVSATGVVIDESTAALCEKTNLLSGLKSLGLTVELNVNSGTNDVSNYRTMFANLSANAAFVAAQASRFDVSGVSFDLEPQVGSPSSTLHDATLYASFLAGVREVLAKQSQRLTACVATWTPMISNFDILAPAVDRLLNMETYHANSMRGWLSGDLYGGAYERFIKAAGVSKGAPGLGCWNQKCGDQLCWSTTPQSGPPRFARMEADRVEEVAMFRLLQQDGVDKMPQSWWWPLLANYLNDTRNDTRNSGAATL